MSKVVMSGSTPMPRVLASDSPADAFAPTPTPLGVLVWICELGLAGLFILAAYNKLIGPNGPQLFSASVQAFKLGLPDVLTRLATSATPWVELIAAVLLLRGVWSRAAATIFALLLMLFIVLIAQALVRGLNVECGCFGKLSPFCTGPLGACNIVQNTVMLAAALLIALTPRHRLYRGASRA
jgi:putative oxidoreductase